MTTIKTLNKKEKEKVKNFYSKLLTKRYTKEEVESNSNLRLPNNTIAVIIDSDIFYFTTLNALYLSRGSCSCSELRNYLISYSRYCIAKCYEGKKDYSLFEELLKISSSEELFKEKIEELFNLKLISLDKNEEFAMLTPNSKSYLTQSLNNGNFSDFDIAKVKKGDLFLRVAQELRVFHNTSTLFNRRTRDKQIESLVEEDKTKELNSCINQGELKNVYILSYYKGIAIFNSHTTNKLTEKRIISALAGVDFISVDDELDSEGSCKFNLNRLSSTKTIFIDKLHKKDIEDIINNSDSFKEVIKANIISFKFV